MGNDASHWWFYILLFEFCLDTIVQYVIFILECNTLAIWLHESGEVVEDCADAHDYMLGVDRKWI